MNTLKQSKDNISRVKREVETNESSIYTHHCISKNTIDDTTITIVMTSSNRSKQTYYTLDTIQRSAYKNVQVVLVDDSTDDPLRIDKLDTYPFSIDFLVIHRDKKFWHNPCVNYNIGFKFIKGGNIIIQNAEVCHVGDVLRYIQPLFCDDHYFVFDVATCVNYGANDAIYGSDTTTTAIYKQTQLFDIWYQSESANRKLHFLTALSRSTFQKVGGFSYDYAFGCSYDDDDLLLRIISNQDNRIVCCHHTTSQCGGIHLFHVRNSTTTGWDNGRELNKTLYDAKKKYVDKYKKYLEVSETAETFDEAYLKLTRC
jgi:glycosyltransferase involved in cell wall biosynthesis